MKETSLQMALRNGAKQIPISLGLALAVTFLHHNAAAQDVDLGTANSFAALAGSAITSTGPTVITGGYVGVSQALLSPAFRRE